MDTETTTLRTISPDMLIPDLLVRHPEARAVLDCHGLRGCGGENGPYETLRFFARAHGVDEARLLSELEDAVNGRSSKTVPAPAGPSIADAIYRRYFIGGILLTLTAGATWGAWMLWTIALSGSFRGVSVHTVNAHGEAQIFGWVGLFIMGFAYQAFPRMWQRPLAAPHLAGWAFILMVVGLITRTIGTGAAEAWSLAVPLAMLGASLEVAAVLIFVAQIVTTFVRSDARFEPSVGFMMGALAWFVAASLMSLWHTWNTMTATNPDDLIWAISTYQSPLRDIQIHGLALFMILGVSLRMLPVLFDLPHVPDRRAWWAFGLLVAAVAGEVILFLLFRWTRHLGFAFGLLLTRALLAVGSAMIVLPWRPWRPFPVDDRSGKFVRAAFAWLAVSLVMFELLPVHRAVSGMPFSHAYFGAIRHAITVGFVSLMIMGIAAKVVPTLNGVDPRTLSRLMGPFLLVNAGCTLRVVLQSLTDWSDRVYPLLGVSGTLEVAGLAWWGFGLIQIMLRGKRASADASSSGPASGPPARVEGRHLVGDVLDWFPEAETILVERGFTALRSPMMRRTMARRVTVAQAAAMRGVDLDSLLDALNAAAARQRQGAETAQCEPHGPLVQIGGLR